MAGEHVLYERKAIVSWVADHYGSINVQKKTSPEVVHDVGHGK
jgi:hypothetical protein